MKSPTTWSARLRPGGTGHGCPPTLLARADESHRIAVAMSAFGGKADIQLIRWANIGRFVADLVAALP